MKRVLIIVNPVAGARQPLGIADRAHTRLAADGWEITVAATKRAGHATALAAAHPQVDLLVVVGGDGTLRETILGLDGRDTPVGLVPVGNANVLARELGIPRTAGAAIEVLGAGVARAIDVGRVNDGIFLAMVSVGYDGWATAGVGRLRSTAIGRRVYNGGGSSLIYGVAGVPPLFRLLPNRVVVTADGQRMPRRYASLVISNAETYALGWAMTPGATIDDGLLDHQLNRRAAPWFVLWTLGAAIVRRRVPALIAEYGRARRYTIASERPFRWQIDGDPMPPATSLEIGLSPASTRILVPAE